MHRMAELVYRLHLHKVISMATKIFQIPGQGCRVAGDIHNALGPKLRHRAHQVRRASLPRHGAHKSVVMADLKPSGPSVMASSI